MAVERMIVQPVAQPVVADSDLKLDSKAMPRYSVEFFHIYVDEKVSDVHTRSLEYLRTVKEAWKGIDYSTIVLIDEYSPTGEMLLSPEGVLTFLESQDAKPDYWALEGDLVSAADALLDSLTDRHLEKNYRRYIEQHGKYPCSLLTATWYLTRLGTLDSTIVKRGKATDAYRAVDRLVNILPVGYKTVEGRARELILKSRHCQKADVVQDLFYEVDYSRKLALF